MKPVIPTTSTIAVIIPPREIFSLKRDASFFASDAFCSACFALLSASVTRSITLEKELRTSTFTPMGFLRSSGASTPIRACTPQQLWTSTERCWAPNRSPPPGPGTNRCFAGSALTANSFEYALRLLAATEPASPGTWRCPVSRSSRPSPPHLPLDKHESVSLRRSRPGSDPRTPCDTSSKRQTRLPAPLGAKRGHPAPARRGSSSPGSPCGSQIRARHRVQRPPAVPPRPHHRAPTGLLAGTTMTPETDDASSLQTKIIPGG